MTDAPSDHPTLIGLKDEPITLSDDSTDVRGYRVLDRDGEEIGQVDDLFVDDAERRVRFLRVQSGGFLGLGGRTFLVPVDAITRIHDDHVHVDQSREHVGGGPEYDPDVIVKGAADYDRIYGHYGYMPFWMGGYAYPMFTPLQPMGRDLRRSADPAAYQPRD